jgi:putative spermidine/putrescine transport system permease protein
VTSFIAGPYDTVPKKMFNQLILEVNPTITAVATLLIALTILALAAVTIILAPSGKLKQTLV